MTWAGTRGEKRDPVAPAILAAIARTAPRFWCARARLVRAAPLTFANAGRAFGIRQTWAAIGLNARAADRGRWRGLLGRRRGLGRARRRGRWMLLLLQRRRPTGRDEKGTDQQFPDLHAGIVHSPP